MISKFGSLALIFLSAIQAWPLEPSFESFARNLITDRVSEINNQNARFRRDYVADESNFHSKNVSFENNTNKMNFRLPTNLKPILYNLTLQPYVGQNSKAWPSSKDFKFDGHMEMTFVCVESTKLIVFHAVELDIDANSLMLKSRKDPKNQVLNSLKYDKRRAFVYVNMTRDCIEDVKYTLSMDYSGSILPVLYGFYISSYKSKGKDKYLAVTDFEPTDARRAFPCMDEPALKAQFKLTLIRHKDFPSTFANTPLVSSKPWSRDPTKSWFVDEFETSVNMSTYLIAYAVTDFKTISRRSPKGVLIQVAARADAIDRGEGDFGLDESVQVIDFFADYFNVSFPLAKSTQIAVPDFNSGAMENWGLCTYKEESLLYNDNTDLITNKRRVAKVIAHELAHQWFGNLVSPKWWNDLWLNEGFASWVEYLGYNYTHPEWRDLEYFFVKRLGPFELDSLESSHAISVEVNDPAEIISLFDSISYSKGSSIIRMMNAYLTEATFKRGVSNYLKAYAFSNAEQDNLWASLTWQAHVDQTLDRSLTVKMIMDTWTLQKGYPVVTLERLDGNMVRLTQKWFLLNAQNTIQDTDEYANHRWYVPFTFTTKSEMNWDFETRPIWFEPSDREIKISLPSETNESDWIIGNIAHAGWYRVNYDEANWDRLIVQLNEDFTQLHPIHRAQLLDDSFNLGRAEIVSQTLFLDMTTYLTQELDPLVFEPALNGLRFMTKFLSDGLGTLKLFKQYYMNLLSNTYDRYGWRRNIKNADEIELQLSVLSIMCKYGHKKCMKKAIKYYDNWMDNGKKIPAEFKSIVFATKIKFGNEQDWRKLYARLLSEENSSEKLRILKALSDTKNSSLLNLLLYKSFDPDVVRSQDRITLISNIAGNSAGRQVAFDYMVENWEMLFALYGGVSFKLPKLVTSCTSKFYKQEDLDKVIEFMTKIKKLGTAADAFKSSIETIKNNMRWIDVNLKEVNAWLILNKHKYLPVKNKADLNV